MVIYSNIYILYVQLSKLYDHKEQDYRVSTFLVQCVYVVVTYTYKQNLFPYALLSIFTSKSTVKR